MIDAGQSPAHAREVQAALTAAGLPQPRWLVYTHHHWDHVWGACAWPGVEIIGHETTVLLLRAEAARPTPRRRGASVGSIASRATSQRQPAEEARVHLGKVRATAEAEQVVNRLVHAGRQVERQGQGVTVELGDEIELRAGARPWGGAVSAQPGWAHRQVRAARRSHVPSLIAAIAGIHHGGWFLGGYFLPALRMSSGPRRLPTG